MNLQFRFWFADLNFFLCSLFAVALVAYILVFYIHSYNSKSMEAAEGFLACIIFFLTIYIAGNNISPYKLINP